VPDSTSLTKKKETRDELWARLKLNHVPPKKKENIEDLPRWVRTALVMKAVDGATYKDIAKRFNRVGDTLSEYAKSPAAKKWLSSDFLDFIDDPVEMAKAYLKAHALSVTLDRVAFLEMAIEAGDYKMGDAIAKDIQEKLGILAPKQKNEGPAVLNITIGSGSVEIPTIEAEWTEVKGEDDED